jgi:tetratricopeptide (TPR) repeat protein
MYLIQARVQGGQDRQKSIADAVKQYSKSNELATRLLEAEPDSAKAKGNLALTHHDLGRAYEEARILDKAKEQYEIGLRLRQQVVDEPGTPGEQNTLRLADVRASLANSYGALADIAKLQKDKPAMNRLLSQAIALEREALLLVETDPDNTQETRGIRVFCNDLARFMIVDARNKLAEQTKEGVRSAALELGDAEHLLMSASDPDNVESQLMLARMMAEAGDSYLFAVADPQAAKEEYDRARVILEQVRKKVDTREVQSEIAMCHYRLGTALLRLKDFGVASAHYQAALVIREQHFKDAPNERAWLTLMVTLARAGDVNRASKMVDDLRPKTQLKEEFPFDAACTYAICAWVTGNWRPDADLTPDQLKQRKEFVAKALVDVKAVLGGGSRFADQLASDPDLEFLHGLPEFKELLAQRKK